MKVRIGALTVLAIAALPPFSGCSSGGHSSSGSGGAPGTGGAGTGGAGTGGAHGTGGSGVADAGPDGRDGGGDGSQNDSAVDAPPATLTQIWTTILSDVASATSPACIGCHDGSAGIPDYTSIATTYATWVGVASTSCPGGIRVTAGNAETSVLINKLRSKPVLGLGLTACGGDPMPLGTNRSITLDQLHLIENWINAGALNN